MLTEARVAVIGAGTMGSLLIDKFLTDRIVPADRIMASDPSPRRGEEIARRFGVRTTASNSEAADGADLVILAVKPQVMATVIDDLREVIRAESFVLSIAAGITTRAIESGFPRTPRVVRVMPNTPVQVEAGATAFCRGRLATGDDAALTRRIFGALGEVVEISEDQMDAVTGLSGSGPAYIFVIVEALSDAGVRVGLSRAQAQFLAIQTVLGAAKMLKDTGTHPAVLKDMVASPGGTAIAGLYEFERSGLRRAIIDAVTAATRRSAELGGTLERDLGTGRAPER